LQAKEYIKYLEVIYKQCKNYKTICSSSSLNLKFFFQN
jgi:hypothetical protein